MKFAKIVLKRALGKSSCQGFTIISWLVSFFITILIVHILFQFTSQFYLNLLSRSKLQRVFLEHYSALDHISRNIAQAPLQKKLWKKISSDEVIWFNNKNKIHIGYIFEKQKIFFIKINNKSKRKNIISSNVKSLKFLPKIVNNQVKAVTCELMYKIGDTCKTFKRVISLKERLI